MRPSSPGAVHTSAPHAVGVLLRVPGLTSRSNPVYTAGLLRRTSCFRRAFGKSLRRSRTLPRRRSGPAVRVLPQHHRLPPFRCAWTAGGQTPGIAPLRRRRSLRHGWGNGTLSPPNCRRPYRGEIPAAIGRRRATRPDHKLHITCVITSQLVHASGAAPLRLEKVAGIASLPRDDAGVDARVG